MPASWLHGIRSRASSLDLLNAVFLAVVTGFALFAAARMPHPELTGLLYLALFALLYAVGRLRFAKLDARITAILLFVYAPVFLFTVYESFALVMPYFRAARFDDALLRIDYAMFGVHPTVWMERWATPWLTDLLYALYFFYFPMPLLILIPMFRRGRYEAVERWIFLFLCAYYSAYLITFFLPAEGPRFHPPPGQSPMLTGLFVAAPIRGLIDHLEPNKLDAFPSLHAAILTMTMLLAWHEARRAFWLLVPAAIGITVSLVYCRYHYVTDVIAGIAWALIAYRIAVWVYPRVRARSAPHFGPDAPAAVGRA